MRNDIFDLLEQEFLTSLGCAENLVSGRGARFRSSSFGRLTVYHANIADGNHAEVAFHPRSIAEATHISEAEVRMALHRLRAGTGVEINFNPQHRWPRVGVRSHRDAALVIAFVQSMLAMTRVANSSLPSSPST